MIVDTTRSPRPRSVTIVAALYALQSLVLLGLAFSAWEHLDISRIFQYTPLALFGQMTSSGWLVLLAAAGLGVALALYTRRSWAWMAAMLLQGLGLSAALVSYIRHQPNYVGMLIGILLVFYLNQHEVQTAFRRRGPELDGRPTTPAFDPHARQGDLLSSPRSPGQKE